MAVRKKPEAQTIPQTTRELQDMAMAMRELTVEIVKFSKKMRVARDEADNTLRQLRKIVRFVEDESARKR